MKLLGAFAAVGALLVAAPPARADYLEIRRAAWLKKVAEADGAEIVHLKPTALVALVDDDQVNGYYKVKTRDGKKGYVYRTLVRRHRGDLPAAPTTPPEPDESPDDHGDADEPRSAAGGHTPSSPATSHLDLDHLPPLGSGGVPEMRAHLINVGQGESILFEFSCGAMLFDTGGEQNGEFNSEPALRSYLEAFFARRADLNRTLDLLVISHPHPDHDLNAEMVFTQFTVKNVVTDGLKTGYGAPEQIKLMAWARQNAKLDTINEVDVPSGGLTDAIIDPLHCQDVDPQLKVFWGGVTERPHGWSKDAFEDENNSSVVTRIDFGKASFLLQGDLEIEGIEALLAKHGAKALDVDVLQVGHHGSKNGTTEDLLAAVTPQIALFGTGDPARREEHSAWSYGHPRKDAVDLLLGNVSHNRPSVTVPVATGQWHFANVKVTRALYATGWDGDVVVTATKDGAYGVVTER
jgi:competence protein ComEC